MLPQDAPHGEDKLAQRQRLHDRWRRAVDHGGFIDPH